jgi:formylglycine-generating enzyme required for sulfatase activity
LPQTASSIPAIIISEVFFYPVYGSAEWVEIHNAGDVPVSLNGWSLRDDDGPTYRFPEHLPPFPAGDFIVVRFDGLGPAADELDFSDHLATLHSPAGMTDLFEDESDMLGLYRFSLSLFLPLVLHGGPTIQASTQAAQTVGSQVVAFVAWGDAPHEGAAEAELAGLWHTSRFVTIASGSGVMIPEQALAPNPSIGLLAGQDPTHAENWVLYSDGNPTPGAVNPPPPIEWMSVDEVAVMSSDGFALGWDYVPHATYQLQMDDSADFTTPAIDLEMAQPFYAPAVAPPAGDYWWRVRAILPPDLPGGWSRTAQVSILPVDALSSLAPGQWGLPLQAETVLPVIWQRQRKDTALLCLDGDPEGNPLSLAEEHAWDTVHPDALFPHGEYNCARAAIAMVAGKYGGNLSQDYLAYRLFENGGDPLVNVGELNDPLYDLGHNRPISGCGASGGALAELMAWALGVEAAEIVYIATKPDFTQFQSWLDAGQPVVRVYRGHATVIGGYRLLSGGARQLRVLDPWDGVSWENYGTLGTWCAYVAPSAAPQVRSDPPEVIQDSDGDGIMDFDEQVRFKTLADSPDSDGDTVLDKADLREYVFKPDGVYRLRSANSDGDAFRKELDPDNDGDGGSDGCEDGNMNGKYEAELFETDNFDARSKKTACGPGSGEALLVPQGEFIMGCIPGHHDIFSCGTTDPMHAVYLDDYLVDKFEVTNAQYAACVSAGACLPPAFVYSRTRPDYYTNPAYADYPVVHVNWNKASAFCAWQGKRLPSEAEWEKSARAATLNGYPWGDARPQCSNATTWNWTTGIACVQDTVPVESYQAGVSPYGVFHLADNVAEWVNDWWSSSYYLVSPYFNPLGPETGTVRVKRGGDFWTDAYTSLNAFRDYHWPTDSSQAWGFRCVKTP